LGGVHAARRSGNGSVEGAGDPRRQGVALTVRNP
jgi:gamma-glutamyltranspeptidase